VWYVERPPETYNEGDRTFYDAITKYSPAWCRKEIDDQEIFLVCSFSAEKMTKKFFFNRLNAVTKSVWWGAC
jgi:hypothetical protein